MAINMMDDLGAPLAVMAIDLTSETIAPDSNELVSYITAGGGYLAAWQGMGGTFVKNMAIAAAPWAAKNLYERIRNAFAPATASRSVALRRTGSRSVSSQRYPAPSNESQFKSTRLTRLV